MRAMELPLSNSRLAVLYCRSIALVVAGLAVQNHWDCQLVRHYAAKDCVPFISGVSRFRIFGPRPRDNWNLHDLGF
jgi:hypothetical protein